MTDNTILRHVLDFLQTGNRIASYLALKRGPYFLAIQGVQGSGKSTLAKQLADTLRSPPWSLPTIVISVDDFYLNHEDQKALARNHPTNPLIQHRGQASTHDIALWKETFEALRTEKPTTIPEYDKSRFEGQGDRVDTAQWQTFNQSELIKVVIFEGWSVGFAALPEDEVKSKWEAARKTKHAQGSNCTGQLANNKLEDLLFVNEALKEEAMFNEYFQDLIQIDSDLLNVYKWRLQQETALRASRGTGMTDEQVRTFIDGYFPSYELYTESLSNGGWRSARPDWKPQHFRILIDDERQVQSCSITE